MIGAAYHHDPQHIIPIVEEIAQSHKRVLSKPLPEALTIDFADFSITYQLNFFVRNPLEALQVGSELRQQIWTAFEANDITIPFPQRQVYPMEWPPADKKTLRQERQIDTTGTERLDAKSNSHALSGIKAFLRQSAQDLPRNKSEP